MFICFLYPVSWPPPRTTLPCQHCSFECINHPVSARPYSWQSCVFPAVFHELSQWIFLEYPILCSIRRLSLIFLFLWKWWADNKASCSWFYSWSGLVIETCCNVRRLLCLISLRGDEHYYTLPVFFIRHFYLKLLQGEALHNLSTVHLE